MATANLQLPVAQLSPAGSNGQVLTVVSGAPAWANIGSIDNLRNNVLSTTSATAVLTYTPAASGVFWVGIYYRVVAATTVVTIAITYTDTAGAQTMTLVSAASTAVGSYALPPVLIEGVASDPIAVNFTAGTASQVYASASILEG